MMFKQLAKDSAIYGGADFLGKALAFFTFPIIAAALSPASFGALELVLTVTALLGLAMNCGLNNSVQRYYWDPETSVSQRSVVVSSGLSAQIVAGVLVFAIASIAAFWVFPEIDRSAFPISGLGLLAALLLTIFSQWLQFALDVVRLHFNASIFLLLTFSNRVLGTLLSVLVVVNLKSGVDGILFVQSFVALVMIPFAFWTIRKDLTFNVNLKWIRELVSFGYPFIFAGLAYWLFGSMDRWMLANMTSVEETGIYSVAFRFSSLVLFVSAAFGKAWSPTSMKLRVDYPEKYRLIYAQVLLLILFLMMIIGGGLALFSGELIAILMPVEYADSAMPLTILCFGIILQSTQQVTAIGISLEKKTFIFTRLTWLTALVNLVLNWSLIPTYGAIGAAWATSISYLVLTSCYLYFTQQLHPLPIPWKSLFILVFIGVVIAIAALYSISSSLRLDFVVYKLFFALTATGVAYSVLPLKSFSYDR